MMCLYRCPCFLAGWKSLSVQSHIDLSRMENRGRPERSYCDVPPKFHYVSLKIRHPSTSLHSLAAPRTVNRAGSSLFLQSPERLYKWLILPSILNTYLQRHTHSLSLSLSLQLFRACENEKIQRRQYEHVMSLPALGSGKWFLGETAHLASMKVSNA